MRLLRGPLIVLSIAPMLSLYKAWRASEAQVKGLLSNTEAQRQVLGNVAVAGVVYALFMVGCFVHLARNRRTGGARKFAWGLGFVLVPMFSLPTYLILHFRPDR